MQSIFNPLLKKGLQLLGIPSGGADGQVLSKASNSDYDVEWTNPAGGGDMLSSTYDPQNIQSDAFDTDNHTDGTNNKVFSATEKTKLAGIESGADVTDATNVAAAGAVMDSELIATSAGAGDAGKPIKLDAAGHVDATMINDADIHLDNVTEGTTNKFFTATEKTKLAGIETGATADQVASEVPVTPNGNLAANDVQEALEELQGDINTINSSLGGLTDAVVLKGTWDASGGSFPGGGSAQAGWSYIVSVAGTVNGVAFAQNDRLLAISDNASTSTYANNWHKLDYTDQVLSVNGETGAVVLDADDISDTSTTKKFTTASDISKLAGIEALADVTDAGNVGSSIHGASGKTTPVDADTMPLIDSVASNVLKKVTWANIKATLKAYFDTLYATTGAYLLNIVEDTTPQLGGDLDTNEKNLDWDAVPSTDNTGIGETTNDINAGETVAFPQVLYMHSDGEWHLADADAIATANAIALALESKNDGQACKALLRGFVRDDDWNWTVGSPIYLSTTAGGLTQTAPSGTDDVVQILGIATHADRMYFNPQLAQVEHV